MSHTFSDSYLILKEYLTGKDYEEIKSLTEICYLHDHTNLKPELDYKLTVTKHSDTGIKNINEFLYYTDEGLVSYLGISCFGGKVYELNGMTHPDFRRKGLFQKLFTLALQESLSHGRINLLLLTDEKSGSGRQFIEQAGGRYKFSEYRMKQILRPDTAAAAFHNADIILKAADKTELKEIARQNAIYFNTAEESETSVPDKEMPHEGMFMIKRKEETIGKIEVQYEDNSAFISGFGILPEYRGLGYGKAALYTLLEMIGNKEIKDIQLDVESKNRSALNLYKAFGFEEISVMNYYEYVI